MVRGGDLRLAVDHLVDVGCRHLSLDDLFESGTQLNEHEDCEEKTTEGGKDRANAVLLSSMESRRTDTCSFDTVGAKPQPEGVFEQNSSIQQSSSQPKPNGQSTSIAEDGGDGLGEILCLKFLSVELFDRLDGHETLFHEGAGLIDDSSFEDAVVQMAIAEQPSTQDKEGEGCEEYEGEQPAVNEGDDEGRY